LNLARVAAEQGARFVYFSTDYVFDGGAGPYDEDDPPRPLSAYGRAKYEAEQALAEALGPLLLTVRTTWVYGPERQGKNFAYQLSKTLDEGRPLVLPSDQVSNPSYGPDVARTVLSLAEAGRSGVVHVAGPDWMDRVQFARALAVALGRDPVLIVARTTAELGQPAARPLKGGLRTTRLEAWLKGSMRPLDPCLADFQARLAEPDDWVRPLRPA
jgi:dTDP-4-dehydrorhamnose reductase